MAQRWHPPKVADGYLGYCLTGAHAAFLEACRRLEVKPLGALKRGHAGRNIGSRVRAEDGTIFWLKVGGVYSAMNRFFLGEPEAGELDGLPKPALIRNLEWRSDLVTWSARLMSFVDAPVIERNPWAVRRAGRVDDTWLAQLDGALRVLASKQTERLICIPRLVADVLTQRYGVEPPPLREWHTAHGDLHWANLTAPELMLLDWEAWGGAPPGYDVAALIAYSATDAELVARLEHVFADVLSSRSVQATRLYVLHHLLESTGNGWVDPALRGPVTEMMADVQSRLRNRGP